MGCVASRIDKEQKVSICKERKKVMKQLVGYRGEFADAQLGYLRALKNTGVTLRQFTESELLELENTAYDLALPPSPPPSLPPSPPPPPFILDSRKIDENNGKEEFCQNESIDIAAADDSCIPSQIQNLWGVSEPHQPCSPHHYRKKSEALESVEDERWAESKTDFEGDQEEEATPKVVVNPLPEKSQHIDLVDDNSSTRIAMLVRRNNQTLEGIVRELDDHFLKASAGVKEIAVLMDINGGDTFPLQGFNENKRKNSAKVFTALSWSWSSKSLQLNKDAVELSGPREPCSPGAHCITLKKLYALEQRLYKEVKEEEITKLEHEKKLFLLQKQENENYDWTKTQKTRLSVESLEADMVHLQQSISGISSSILELIDEELYPQLVALTSGLMHMWKTMYECHKVQNHISKQLNHLHDNQSTDLSTDYHRQATAQLETEVTYWFSSFSKLIKSQSEYVRTLRRWIQLTNSLGETHQHGGYSSAVRRLCEGWQLALDGLPDKVASEAIKTLLNAIDSIRLQQEEEYNLQRKSDKLEKKLQKELDSLSEMETKFEESFAAEETVTNLSPKHPLSLKRAKTEALKKQVESEKAKYLISVNVSSTMTLNKLKTSLPNLFHALMEFSSAFAQGVEAIHNNVQPTVACDNALQNSTN